MLEFNNEHKSLNGNLKARKGLKIKNIIASGALIASIMLFSGCSKNVECNISDPHAHYYTNEQSFDKYITGEKETVGKWTRTEDYIIIDKDTEKLINFENKNKLFRISYNKDKINEITDLQNDYIEYRYKYTQLIFIPLDIDGEIKLYPALRTAYSWTTNLEKKGLTGEQRVVSRVYYGYKIINDQKGKLKLIQSEMVDNLKDLPDDFIYVKSKFYKTVYLDNKNLEVDYEDGPEELHPNYDIQKEYKDLEYVDQDELSKGR